MHKHTHIWPDTKIRGQICFKLLPMPLSPSAFVNKLLWYCKINQVHEDFSSRMIWMFLEALHTHALAEYQWTVKPSQS